MPDMTVVELSRLQFALTAMYHFLFVPLTLGLSFMIAIMESVYVMTGRDIWRRMTLFWGTLFGVNFAMGVATGIVMEFQFGMNWSYYSHYVGDIFGAPLAIEGLMAFFLVFTSVAKKSSISSVKTIPSLLNLSTIIFLLVSKSGDLISAESPHLKRETILS